MSILRRNISVVSGDTFEQSFDVFDDNGDPVDFTELSVVAVYGKTLNMVNVLHEVTEDEPSIYQHYEFDVDVTDNTVTLSSASLPDIGKYVYMVYHDDEEDTRVPIIEGEFIITSVPMTYTMELPIDGEIIVL